MIVILKILAHVFTGFSSRGRASRPGIPFFAISLQGEFTVRFGRDEGGAVTGFTFAVSGLEVEATRVDSDSPDLELVQRVFP